MKVYCKDCLHIGTDIETCIKYLPEKVEIEDPLEEKFEYRHIGASFKNAKNDCKDYEKCADITWFIQRCIDTFRYSGRC